MVCEMAAAISWRLAPAVGCQADMDKLGLNKLVEVFICPSSVCSHIISTWR